ncbi:MAG: hypothetical protein A2Z72_01840 [Omnitrophica bacterium RBG_13_46_9]|nr:MAG: hypothetical protein A2Z72_01840 [Omnitrophica bacterium RBG_13_46_9]
MFINIKNTKIEAMIIKYGLTAPNIARAPILRKPDKTPDLNKEYTDKMADTAKTDMDTAPKAAFQKK